jgi:hypothetical protein
MSAVDPSLRLSAQRALLGAISPEIRLIKLRRDGDQIVFTTIASRSLSEDVKKALSVAATEVIADFPGCRVDERLTVSSEPLPAEDIIKEGWVYRRIEPVQLCRERLDVWHDGSAICIIAVGSCGEPLDLGEGEVEALIEKLQASLTQDGD